MNTVIEQGNAEPETTAEEKTNVTVADFAASRIKALEAQAPVEATQPEAGPEAENEAEAEVVETAEAEAEAAAEVEETQGEVEAAAEVEEAGEREVLEEAKAETKLSKLELDALSEAELTELSEKLGSRAVARYGELTAKRKAAEEKLARMQAALEAQQQQNPLETVDAVTNNPYRDIKNLEGLQAKAREVGEIIEWAEDVLFNADGYGPEDEVTEVEGKGITKAEVRKTLLNARKSRDRYLPAQLQALQKKEQSAQLKNAFAEQARKELDWLEGEDNDTRARYEAMLADPRFKALEETVDPEVSAQLSYILAHAANSLYGAKPNPPAKTKAALRPPTGASPSNNAAGAPNTQASSRSKAIKEMHNRFKASGEKDDYVRLRTIQLANQT